MADWLAALAPLAGAIINKLSNNQRVKPQEQNFILLYSLTEATQKNTQELVLLRQDFNRLCSAVENLQKTVFETRVEVARLQGKVE